MKVISVLFAGCGDLGIRAGSRLLSAGWRVGGLRRDPGRLPAGFQGCAGDYTAADGLAAVAHFQPDYVVATFTPRDRSVEGYRCGFELGARNLLASLGGHRPRGLVWVSSTRVYAERDGGWVDEGSALAFDEPRASAMIAAESAVSESGLQSSVIRFAGIYGAPDGRLLERVGRGELCPSKPVHYSNRIHREDAAGFLCHLLLQAEAGVIPAPVYNGVDDLPAPQYEVESWLCGALGAEPVPVSIESPNPIDRTFSSGHKRCSNRLLHSSGYALRYPDYRSGYSAVLACREQAGQDTR